MRVALVYDRVNSWGGAERVLLALHRIFPDAPLYTSVYDPKKTAWADVFPKIIPSFLQNFPLIKTRHDLFPFLMPIAFESFDFSSYDLVVSVTSEAAKGIITVPGTKHICYCLTPTRYLWSGYSDYFKSFARRFVSYPIVYYLKKWDVVAIRRPDIVIGISETVIGRIKKYYGRKSKLIYPPVDMKIGKASVGEYYLVVSRLVPYKKIDIVVDLFNQINKEIIIVGDGSERRKLEKRANNNIKFVGKISDNSLMRYYANCKALIFPQEEDFGIVAVEAQLAGKPVIAYRAGAAIETVLNGVTGVFFDRQDKKSLFRAIQKFEAMEFKSIDCRRNASKFSYRKFKREFDRLLLSDG